jgi:hypothetical protein
MKAILNIQLFRHGGGENMQLEKQIILSYGITTIPNTSTLIPTLNKPRINLRIHLRHDTNLPIWGVLGFVRRRLIQGYGL